MSPDEMLDELVGLAGEAGLDVRVLTGRGDVDAGIPTRSGVCRVRGDLWVVLAAADSLEDRIAVVCGALREHAASFLEDRYLPPAVRERLEGH